MTRSIGGERSEAVAKDLLRADELREGARAGCRDRPASGMSACVMAPLSTTRPGRAGRTPVDRDLGLVATGSYRLLSGCFDLILAERDELVEKVDDQRASGHRA